MTVAHIVEHNSVSDACLAFFEAGSVDGVDELLSRRRVKGKECFSLLYKRHAAEGLRQDSITESDHHGGPEELPGLDDAPVFDILLEGFGDCTSNGTAKLRIVPFDVTIRSKPRDYERIETSYCPDRLRAVGPPRRRILRSRVPCESLEQSYDAFWSQPLPDCRQVLAPRPSVGRALI
jgi:hypothetical protein